MYLYRHSSQREGYSLQKLAFGWLVLHCGQYFIVPVGLEEGSSGSVASAMPTALARPGPASIWDWVKPGPESTNAGSGAFGGVMGAMAPGAGASSGGGNGGDEGSGGGEG